MFVMEAAPPPVTLNPGELLLLGIPWYVFIMLILIFILMGIILAILGIQRAKMEAHRREAIGKVLLEILPATGGNLPIEWALVSWHKSEAKVYEDSSKRTWSSPLWADAPKGHSCDFYLLPDEHDYNTGWPIGAKPWEQTPVACYIVHKNFPWPECPHDASKWDNLKIIQRSSAMIGQAQNEVVTHALMSPQMAFAEQMRLMVQKMKWLIVAAITAGIAAVLGLANIGIDFLYIGRNMETIAKFLTGK
jgi:hypothetical protein